MTKALIPEVLLFTSLELSAQVDKQKRVIRKLILKVSKLEQALKKERKETKQPKICSMSDIPLNTQFSALKDEIERSKMLEDAVSKIYNQTAQIIKVIS